MRSSTSDSPADFYCPGKNPDGGPGPEIWDAIVIGAGPAGSVTAREMARSGCRVLLVDKANFPRSKVCGCCLNGSAIGTLNCLGLGHVLKDAAPVSRVKISSQYRTAELVLSRGLALSRDLFDTRLVEEAEKAGVEFRPSTPAKLGALQAHRREVTLKGSSTFARVVIQATGLAGGSTEVEPGSRIGAGAMIPANWSSDFFAAGTIYMATGRHGYVGLVRVEDDRLDIAAAFDASFVKMSDGLGQAALKILKEVGWPLPAEIVDLPWKGTPALTRKPLRIAQHRLFAVGDAAGYIEPFTGEGMAWAIQSARILAPIASRAVKRWDAGLAAEWEAIHRRVLGPKQRFCRLVAQVLRSPILRPAAILTLSKFPQLARPVLAFLNQPRSHSVETTA